MDDASAVHDLGPVLRLTVVRLARRIRKQSPPGLTPSQQSALATIGRHGPMRLGELAEREQISKSSVTRLAGKLGALRVVERSDDESDGRSTVIALSQHGRAVLEAAASRADEYLAHHLAALDADDRRRIREALPALERLLAVRP